MSKAKCQAKAEEFLKQQNHKRFTNTKLIDSSDDYVKTLKNNSKATLSYNYFYSRFNEGVLYKDNYLQVTMDSTTGKVTHFNSNWYEEVVFEKPENLINEEKAKDSYLTFPGFELCYEINTIHNYDTAYKNKGAIYDSSNAYSVNYESRLVYSTQFIDSNLVSPYTGKQLNYSGNEIMEDTSVFTKYGDIAGSAYERSIQILHDMGLNEYSNKFYPNQYITGEEFLEICSVIGLYRDTAYIEEVKSSKVTKELAAKYAITLLGYESIGTMQGIFTTGYKDEDSISSECLGFVALVKGFGFSIGKENTFGPKERLTRGEAAQFIVELIDKR